MVRTAEELKAYVLYQGVDDWVPLEAIVGFVCGGHEVTPALQRMIERTLLELVDEDLVVLGKVTKGKGFEPLEVAKDARRLLVEGMLADYISSQDGFKLWTCNTASGDVLGKQQDPDALL